MIKTFFKILLSTILATIILSAALLYTLPFLISSDNLKSYVEQVVEGKTGKKFKINGIAEFSLVPEISLTITDATIADPTIPEKAPDRFEKLHFNIEFSSLIINDLHLYGDVVRNGISYIFDTDITNFNEVLLGTPSKINILVTSPIAASLHGELIFSSNLITLSDIKFTLNNTSATGNMKIEIKDDFPEIAGEFLFKTIDIGDLMLMGAGAGSAEIAASPLPAKNAPQPVWDTRPLNFDWLNDFNASIKISAEIVTDSRQKGSSPNLGPTTLVMLVADGRFTANLLESTLYEGNGTGKMTLDSSAGVTHIYKEFSFRGIDVGQIVSDTTSFKRLHGKGNLEISVKSEGASIADIINNLNGYGSLNVVDGSITGIDLMAMANSSPENIISAFNSANKSTKILALSSTFKIEQGIIRNNDFLMKAPFSNISGKGEINLPQLLLKYRFTPEVGNNRMGLSVPIILEGDLRNPEIKPDIKGLITNNIDVKKLLEKDGLKNLGNDLENLGKNLKKGLLDKF